MITGTTGIPKRLLAWSLPAAAAILAASPAKASEGGASFYLLGSGGPGAAVMPPVEGIFFDNTFYFYSGEASADRQFVVGGNLVAGLDAKIIADFATVLWVPGTNALGGTLAIGAALPVGYPAVTVDAVITGPLGGQIAVSRNDQELISADPVLTAALGWNTGGNTHVQLSTTINIPIGHYREDELANLSFHRWAVDTSLAFSWHDPKAGWDISAKAGVTFNGTNDHTDYNTGNELHLRGIDRTNLFALLLGRPASLSFPPALRRQRRGCGARPIQGPGVCDRRHRCP